MANRFIGGVLSSRPQANTPFSSRASTGTYFDKTGVLVTATSNQPRLNYNFTGQISADRYSALFTSASSNYLSLNTAASALGTGNFTMEFWWKANSTTQSNYSNIINQGFTGSPSNGAFSFKVFAGTGSNILNFTYYNNGISDNSTSANVNDLAWHHIAASRNGTSLGIYVDGALNTTITLPANFNMGASGGTTYIGYNPRDASYINGYVKDVRIITGQALYTGAFTPPTAPLTRTTVGSTGAGAAATLTGTVILLTCQTASLNDVSSNNYTITNTNAVTASLLLPNNLGIDSSGTGWSKPAVLIEPASTNFLTYSEDLSNGAWANNNSITTNQAAAPDGTTTADLIYPSSSGSWSIRYQQNPTGTTANTTGYTYTISVFAKASGKSWLFLGDDNTTTRGVWFNVSTGVIGTTGSGMLNGRIEFVGNGWYRCQVTYITTGVVRNLMAITDADNSASVTVSGSNGILIWGAQLEERFTATSYIPTTTAGVTRAADVVGPGTSGIYSLEDRQTTTANDDQATVQTFTSTGSYSWTAPADVVSVEVLVVAGGGSGGGGSGAIGAGGGGAGGIIYNTSYPVTPGTTYPVVVGAGGVGANRLKGTNGSNSQFDALVALGGGAGASDGSLSNVGTPGGSGGGGGGRSGIGAPGTAGQGYSGSNGAANAYYAGGAGGGAGGPATPFIVSVAGSGGPGLYFNISGTSTAYGGGGGGGGSSYSSVSTAGSGGVGGGGAGTSTSINGNPGTANTGGGGGASGWSTDSGAILGGSGGSGIVIVKYKRTARQISSTSNAAVVVQKFTTTVSAGWTAPAGVTQVEALVIGGGGSGGNFHGGGGGAGGLIYNSAFSVTPGTSYTVTVGDGGAPVTVTRGNNGGNSVFGANVVSNGTFDSNTTGWTANTTGGTGHTFTATGGVMSVARAVGLGIGYGEPYQILTVEANKQYVMVIDVGTTQMSLNVGPTIGTSTFYGVNLSVGRNVVYFTPTGTTAYFAFIPDNAGTTSTVDNVSVSKVETSLIALGGGGGGNEQISQTGVVGGSGGGGSYNGSGGAGTAGQGNAGGTAVSISAAYAAAGGGGAGSVGGNPPTFSIGGVGGTGLPFSITGNLEYYAGGGGGSVYNAATIGFGGLGGGGNGGSFSSVIAATNGSANTGGGGGGGERATGANLSGAGGSGVVILRYRVPQVATFLDSGAWTCPAGVTSVQALIVAGGGSGSGNRGSTNGSPGGGAGGVVYSTSIQVTPGVIYPVVVGKGATTNTSEDGYRGQNSSFANIIAIGGGGGNGGSSFDANRFSGGSGGGAGESYTNGQGVYGQGNAGGTNTVASSANAGAGGGGAGGAGGSIALSVHNGGNGGPGLAFSISGTSTYYGGGGGGSRDTSGSVYGTGGVGGGGNSTVGTYTTRAGTPNTGGGGGGAFSGVSADSIGGYGGSGIVIIRWVGA